MHRAKPVSEMKRSGIERALRGNADAERVRRGSADAERAAGLYWLVTRGKDRGQEIHEI